MKAQRDDDYEEVFQTPSKDAEVRARREYERIFNLPERGVVNPVERETLNFPDIYADAATPKIPPRDIKPLDTPQKEKGFYGNIYSSALPKPTNAEEADILAGVEKDLNSMQVKDLKVYIKSQTNRSVPKMYTRKDLIYIATILGYEEATGARVKTGSGLRRVRPRRGGG